jgi:hypothetical protein
MSIPSCCASRNMAPTQCCVACLLTKLSSSCFAADFHWSCAPALAKSWTSLSLSGLYCRLPREDSTREHSLHKSKDVKTEMPNQDADMQHRCRAQPGAGTQYLQLHATVSAASCKWTGSFMPVHPQHYPSAANHGDVPCSEV